MLLDDDPKVALRVSNRSGTANTDRGGSQHRLGAEQDEHPRGQSQHAEERPLDDPVNSQEPSITEWARS